MSIVFLMLGGLLIYFGCRHRQGRQAQSLKQVDGKLVTHEKAITIARIFKTGADIQVKVMMIISGGLFIFFGLIGLLAF